MTILVTGALGFAGLGIVRGLAGRHPERRVVASDLEGPDEAVAASLAGCANVRTARLDVTDREAVAALFAEERPAFVVHAAALTPMDESNRAAVFDVNLGGTVNVLEAAVRTGVHRTVVASSSGVYARVAAAMRHEDDALDPGNVYAASKMAAEAAAACYGAVAVRIGPVYGPLERAKPSRPRISAVGVMASALASNREVTLLGPDVARDWTHVDDIAAGIDGLLTAERRPSHTIYNLSAGRAETLTDVAKAFQAHGLQVRWTDDPAKADIAHAAADARPPLSIARLAADTGYSPRHTLMSGIAALISDS